ncbi:hypothetical protein [Microtetraspora sp. NBRC 16547]|uniref:hypothetical protein n=1 Tax=Microtetraspora sp. NBRC 16547 TaxID=3030993 RepID=UPI0024A43284|nr:hypothetical protein [Microtetraspora sp. NBRC 16547]GLW96463.1 hypothetical protein Misp02_05500 [Microtetraspora sp. NBRC 16547]
MDHVVTASCPKGPDPDLPAAPRQPLPDGFVPVQVIRCRWESRYLPGKGRWEVMIQEHADGPATELMTELRRPSEKSLFGQDCLDIGILVDYFVVADSSGRAVLPDVPTGVCGGPFSSTLAAIRSLPYHVDEQVPIRRVESEKAFRAGCGDEYSDILRRRGRPGVAHQVWNPPLQGLRVCVFRITKKTPSTVEPGPMATGRLESSRILKGTKLRTLLNALDAAPASDCPSNHTRFAVLNPGHYRQAYVELDGCHNLLRPDGTLGQLAPDAVALLTK